MKIVSSVFSYKDYKIYLSRVLEERSQIHKGQRLRLAEFLNCRPSYVSQVLNGDLHLSPEQAFAVNKFLGLTETESRFFLSLVHYARAGSQDLKKYHDMEIKKQLDDHALVKNRVQSNRSLSEMDQAKYYKSWILAAIHMIVSIPEYRKREKIADALGLPQKTVNEAVEFLLNIGMLKETSSQLEQGERSLLIGGDSPFHIRHQTNWRVQALKSLDQPLASDLHYSGVITCSNQDLEKIREILIEAIQSIRNLVKDSKDETLAVYNIDLFGLLK